MDVNDLLTKTEAHSRKNRGFLVNLVDQDIVNRLPEKAPDRRADCFLERNSLFVKTKEQIPLA